MPEQSSVSVIVEHLTVDGSEVQCILSVPKATLAHNSTKSQLSLSISSCLSTQTPAYGSLVYALPSRKIQNDPASISTNSTQSKPNVISTNLFYDGESIDFTSRCATLLATKNNRPVYVNSNVPSYGDSAALTVAIVQLVDRVLAQQQ